MSIPAYSDIILPLLQFASDGNEHHIREAMDELAIFMKIPDEERNQLMPNGNQPKFDYRTHWANTYLKKAHLLESTGRGTFRITRRGLDVLAQNPLHIDKNFLMQFPEFEEFATRSTKSEKDGGEEVSTYLGSEQTPRELIHSIHEGLRKELADELIEYVLSASPAFFERMVVELLLAMGYGGALGMGQVTQITSDGGIDGIIQEDKLGLDMIYIQAKRWKQDHVVGRPDVQGFAGSLSGEGATKGVFITTSSFSKSAVEYVQRVSNLKIILINGTKLAQLMIEHNIGVSVEATYVVKKVDRDFFDVD